jgi:hypothetical protein
VTSAGSLVTRAAAVGSRSISWAWTGRLAIGYLTVLTGVEGVGKSVFAAWLTARLTRADLPGEWRGTPVDVLIVAGEDGIADTWRPRLELAGADLDRVAFLNLNALSPAWNVRDGIEDIRRAIAETGAKFVHVDALLDHMPPPRAGESINSPTFVRQAVGPLKRLVRELQIVAAFGLHPPKARSADFRDLVQASQAFSAIPRVGLLFAYHPDDDVEDENRRRVVVRGKGNLGKDPGALQFCIGGRPLKHDDGRTTEREVVVDVAPSAITLADLAPERVVGARKPTKGEQAAEILRAELADCDWHPAALVRQRLAEEGLDSGSVREKATRLARVEKRKTERAWWWRILPEGEGSNHDGPVASARARCLSDGGLFDLEGPDPYNDGNGPRVRDRGPTELECGKSPCAGGLAYEREATAATETESRPPLTAAGGADPSAPAWPAGEGSCTLGDHSPDRGRGVDGHESGSRTDQHEPRAVPAMYDPRSDWA